MACFHFHAQRSAIRNTEEWSIRFAQRWDVGHRDLVQECFTGPRRRVTGGERPTQGLTQNVLNDLRKNEEPSLFTKLKTRQIAFTLFTCFFPTWASQQEQIQPQNKAVIKHFVPPEKSQWQISLWAKWNHWESIRLWDGVRGCLQVLAGGWIWESLEGCLCQWLFLASSASRSQDAGCQSHPASVPASGNRQTPSTSGLSKPNTNEPQT